MPRRRGESIGTLYRTLVQESQYSRRRNVRSERLMLIEQLGHLHRKKKLTHAASLDLGRIARSKKVPPPRASADVLGEVKEWRERERRSQFASTLADQLKIIQRLQIANEPVPPQRWLELDRAQRARHLLPTVPTPGPGAYRRMREAPTTPTWSFPRPVVNATTLHDIRDRGGPEPPGPGAYLRHGIDDGEVVGEAHRFDTGAVRLIAERSTYRPRPIPESGDDWSSLDDGDHGGSLAGGSVAEASHVSVHDRSLGEKSLSTAGDDTTISAHTRAFVKNPFTSKKIPPKDSRTSAWRQGSVRRNY